MQALREATTAFVSPMPMRMQPQRQRQSQSQRYSQRESEREGQIENQRQVRASNSNKTAKRPVGGMPNPSANGNGKASAAVAYRAIPVFQTAAISTTLGEETIASNMPTYTQQAPSRKVVQHAIQGIALPEQIVQPILAPAESMKSLIQSMQTTPDSEEECEKEHEKGHEQEPAPRPIKWDRISTQPHRNIITHNLQLKQLRNDHRLPQMMDLLQEMRSHGMVPDVVSYATCLQACRNMNDLQAAAELLSQMKQDNVTPDQHIYSILISIYGHSSPPRVTEALAVFDSMRSSGFLPNTVTCNVLLDACARGHEVFHALQVYGIMKEYNIKTDALTFCAMSRVYSNVRMFNEAEEMLNLMTRSGIPPSSLAYNQLLEKMSEAGKSDNAYELFRKMREQGVAPNSNASRALLEASKDNSKRVRKVVKYMTKAHMDRDVNVFNQILSAYSCCKLSEDAMSMYLRATDQDVALNSVSYRLMFEILGDSYDVDGIEALVEDLKDLSVSTGTFASGVASALACSDLELAFRIFYLMREQLRRDQVHQVPARFFDMLLKAVERLGETNVGAVIDEMRICSSMA